MSRWEETERVNALSRTGRYRKERSARSESSSRRTSSLPPDLSVLLNLLNIFNARLSKARRRISFVLQIKHWVHIRWKTLCFLSRFFVVGRPDEANERTCIDRGVRATTREMSDWATRRVAAFATLLLSTASSVVEAQVEREQGPPYTTCGPECQRQVKILEVLIGFRARSLLLSGLACSVPDCSDCSCTQQGFFVLLILGFAIGVGVCCLKAIDTPMSKAGHAHHHGDHHYQGGGSGGASGRSKKRD